MAAGPRPLPLNRTSEVTTAQLTFMVLRGPAAGRDLSVHAFQLEPFDTGVLTLLRYLALATSEPHGAAWRCALTVAEERWPGNGGRVTLDLMAVLDTLPRAMGRAFRTIDPLDLESRAFLTGDEDAMVKAIAAMRRDETPVARSKIAHLTDGRMDPALIQAALSFANAHKVVRATGPERIRALPKGAMLH